MEQSMWYSSRRCNWPQGNSSVKSLLEQRREIDDNGLVYYDSSKMTRWAIGMYFNLHDHKAAWTLVQNKVPNKPLPSCVHCTEKILINCSHTRHAITFAFLAAKHSLYIQFLWSAWKSSQNWTNPVFLKLESRCTVTFTQGSQAFFKTGRLAVF